MASIPTIVCKQCNHANEPERVYCHNCGAKLDRSLLPKEPPKEAKESAEKARRRVKKMTNPARGFFLHWQKLLLQSFLLAVSCAGLIQAARPPAGIPKPPTHDELMEAQPLAEQIEGQQGSPAPRQFTISEQVANLYLAKTIRPGAGAQDDYFKFERAFVNFGQDVCKVTAQESAFGHPIYAGAMYKLSISGNKLLATNIGGNLGRLPVHPLIMEYSQMALQHLWEALARERKLMDNMQSVSVQPGQITMVTKPAGSPR